MSELREEILKVFTIDQTYQDLSFQKDTGNDVDLSEALSDQRLSDIGIKKGTRIILVSQF